VTVVALDTRRRDKLGGSEAAAACGVDPWRSPLMLWFEKLNGIDTKDNEAMALGRALQPAVADILGERGYDVMPAPAEGFTHPTLPWMVVHPDGLYAEDGERGIAEIKTRGTGWSDDDDRALYSYVMQLQHGMEVTGTSVGLLAILHGGHGGLRLETMTVERDDALVYRMVELEERFLECVRTETPPAPRGTDSDADAIRLMFPSGAERSTRALGELWRDVRELRQREEQLREVKAQRDELRQRLQLAMGDATELYSPHDQLVATWRDTLTHRFDSKAFQADHPKLYERYNRALEGRRFLLK